ncbi:MAG: TetR/AcrR family transcriptional regulator [Candidatus Dadabacteria bacterium]|nr:MAG: TetR/AcrR family transcriptional regulator [Candidatus Dadabacteria bacterium]
MRAEARRQQILDAATAAFAGLGYQRSSIAVVCERAGIARGTLYQYFRDKQDLFRAVLEQYSARIRALVAPPTSDELATADVATLIRDRLRAIFAEIAAEREVYRILFNEARAADAETRDLVDLVHQRLIDQLQQTFSALRDLGEAQIDDARLAAEFAIGGVLQIAASHILNDDSPVDADALADATARFAVRLILPPLSTGGTP